MNPLSQAAATQARHLQVGHQGFDAFDIPLIDMGSIHAIFGSEHLIFRLES